jgi:uncharacterized protein YtpQ (UPF0354 family)
MAELSREEFLSRTIAHVREKFPLAKVSPGEPDFSLKVNGHIASLENVYRLSILRPDEMNHHVERWMVELLRAAEGTPDREGTFEELKDRIFPLVIVDSSGEAAKVTVTQPLVDDLVIGYAIDADRTISYIPRELFETWNTTIDELHEQALTNLVGRSEAINAHAAEDESGKINLILFQTMDGYDASRILLPMLHDRLREYLGSPFAAGIPNRDILLCFRNDDATVERLTTQIADDFRRMPHQVTEKLLLVTPDGIAPR